MDWRARTAKRHMSQACSNFSVGHHLGNPPTVLQGRLPKRRRRGFPDGRLIHERLHLHDRHLDRVFGAVTPFSRGHRPLERRHQARTRNHHRTACTRWDLIQGGGHSRDEADPIPVCRHQNKDGTEPKTEGTAKRICRVKTTTPLEEGRTPKRFSPVILTATQTQDRAITVRTSTRLIRQSSSIIRAEIDKDSPPSGLFCSD